MPYVLGSGRDLLRPRRHVPHLLRGPEGVARLPLGGAAFRHLGRLGPAARELVEREARSSASASSSRARCFRRSVRSSCRSCSGSAARSSSPSSPRGGSGGPFETVVQLLAGIPSVVFGLVGLMVVVPFIAEQPGAQPTPATAVPGDTDQRVVSAGGDRGARLHDPAVLRDRRHRLAARHPAVLHRRRPRAGHDPVAHDHPHPAARGGAGTGRGSRARGRARHRRGDRDLDGRRRDRLHPERLRTVRSTCSSSRSARWLRRSSRTAARPMDVPAMAAALFGLATLLLSSASRSAFSHAGRSAIFNRRMGVVSDRSHLGGAAWHDR